MRVLCKLPQEDWAHERSDPDLLGDGTVNVDEIFDQFDEPFSEAECIPTPRDCFH